MPRDHELYPSDVEYYEDPYVDDQEAQMLCDQEEYLFGDGINWDEEDLTEAEYQDRSWDEYEDGVFYYGEEGEGG